MLTRRKSWSPLTDEYELRGAQNERERETEGIFSSDYLRSGNGKWKRAKEGRRGTYSKQLTEPAKLATCSVIIN
ncbi:hypothetical protein B296_00018496 [Ensete ventricosum]|uniref:Uncharacterized protein n=1 Tax=Ensete ventricosum TaxID=4639 RepID=A0A426YIV2_ENSVE|nr:hypothetical protein B296_00018496 [Ensete ventricosum]